MSEQNLNQYEPGNGNNSGQGDPGNKGNEGRNGSGGSGKDPKRQSIVLFLIAALVTLLLMSSFMKMMSGETQKEISYNEFIQMLEDNKVESVTISTDRVNIKPKEEEKANKLLYLYGSPSAVTYYTGKIEDDDTLTQRLLKYDVPVKGEVADSSSVIISFLLTYVVPILLMWVLLSFLFRKMSKGGGPMGVGKSTAKVYVQKETGITFKDVAGEDEAKESLQEVVDFLHNPGKYAKIGAKLPKGALLVGPPGTGKTLLAKAVAGEANVPFFSLSGSEFVEMFVGVGASRVRDLFRKANNMAPCIIFIDEIDAIGGKRDTRHGGGDSEREQTLNQLLSEMDGFDSSKGIIVLAATNRPEVLDKALLRPGRFDRRIIVSKPDMQGRIDTLKVHSKNVKMDETVDFKELALATSGAVGADLANIINEAALMAVRNKRDYVSQKDLIASVEVVFAGKEKKEKLLSPREKKIVAYHEVGHALVAALQKNTLPIQRITIVPRTSGALGYVWQVPEEEKQLQTKKEMEEDIVTFLAGRAAEELKFDSVTNGASNDIEKATSLARTMITMYGMSEKFGMVQLEGVTGEYLDNRRVLNCSSETETKVDTEVKNMMKASYEKAYKLLKKNMPTLDAIAQVLYEKENLSGKEFMELYEKYQNVKLTEAEKVQ